jgi:hypothetical protein
VERTQRILERFPQFYMTWDKQSIIHDLVTSLGKQVDESEKELDSVLRSHWLDTAAHGDLNKLGRMFNINRNPGEPDPDYRNRLKRAIIEFKGGGTRQAIMSSVRLTLGLPPDYPLEMIENPEKEVYREFSVQSGDTWAFSSESILDAEPVIDMSLQSEDESINKPTITNIDTGEAITFNGKIGKGQTLTIGDGRAMIDGKEVKKSLSTTKPPRLPRRVTEWAYNEPISEEIGVFDTAVFDESKFAIGIPQVRLGFKWITHQPATFELRVPRSALTRKESLKLAQDAVESIKATGVKAIINVVED